MKSHLTLRLPMAFLCSLLCSLLCSAARAAEPVAGKQVEQSFKAKDSAEVPYLLYLPENYDANSKTSLPIMLFLHGRGESNGPLSLVAKWGPPQMVERGETLPFILLSPQCPKEDSWSSPTQQARLSELLDWAVERAHAAIPAEHRVHDGEVRVQVGVAWHRHRHPHRPPALGQMNN